MPQEKIKELQQRIKENPADNEAIESYAIALSDIGENEEAPIFKVINKAYNFDFGVKCWKCKTEFNDYQTIPVKALDGTTRFYCPDCIHDIEWCGICGEAYECAEEDRSEMGVCYDCRGN